MTTRTADGEVEAAGPDGADAEALAAAAHAAHAAA